MKRKDDAWPKRSKRQLSLVSFRASEHCARQFLRTRTLSSIGGKFYSYVVVAKTASIFLTQWPGNVRELENVIERLVVLCEHGEIGLTDLPPNISKFVSEKKFPQPTLSNKELDFRTALKQFEDKLIDEALRLADGNKAMAARMLKLNRTTLVAKLRSRTPRKATDESLSCNVVG
jgi:DNA-binding NtrC family response regulator